jgi:hypothetical protein
MAALTCSQRVVIWIALICPQPLRASGKMVVLDSAAIDTLLALPV